MVSLRYEPTFVTTGRKDVGRLIPGWWRRDFCSAVCSVTPPPHLASVGVGRVNFLDFHNILHCLVQPGCARSRETLRCIKKQRDLFLASWK